MPRSTTRPFPKAFGRLIGEDRRGRPSPIAAAAACLVLLYGLSWALHGSPAPEALRPILQNPGAWVVGLGLAAIPAVVLSVRRPPGAQASRPPGRPGPTGRAPSSPVLVSVHIPKCGGTSFQHVLLRIHGRRRVLLDYNPSNLFQLRTGASPLPPNIRCIHGHFPSDTFDLVLPRLDYVTWLRHPVQRVVSNYHHFLRHPDPENPCCRSLLENALSLEQFAALPGMRNEMTRYLAGKPLGAFKFVGIMERYEESLQSFGRIFGVPVPHSPPRENVNPLRTGGSYTIPDSAYQRILSLNLDDLALYEEALAGVSAPATGRQPELAAAGR